MSTLALIGLGSNLGDRRAILDAAVAALADSPRIEVQAVSAYHETAPVGGPSGQGPFLNAAAKLQTTLDAHALLQILRGIERQAGRVRVARWGERTLDLDLLSFDNLVLKSPELTLPHPRMAVRRFVLAPLAEIAPEVVDPLTGRSIAQLLENLDRRPSVVALEGPNGSSKEHVFHLLSDALGAVVMRTPDRSAGTMAQPAENLQGHELFPSAPLDRWRVVDCSPALLLGCAGDRIEPTFIAVLKGAGKPNLDPFVGTPLLWLNTDNPDTAAAEILAACWGSRV